MRAAAAPGAGAGVGEGGARRPRARTHSPALAALLSPPVRADAAAPPAPPAPPPPPPSAPPPPRPGRAPFPLPGARASDRRGKPPPAARRWSGCGRRRPPSPRGPRWEPPRPETPPSARAADPDREPAGPPITWTHLGALPSPDATFQLCPGRLPLCPHTQGDGREPPVKDGLYPFSLGEMPNRPLALEGALNVLQPLASGCTQSAALASRGNFLALQPQAC